MKLKKKTFKTVANVKKTTVEQIITRLQQLLIYTINTNIGGYLWVHVGFCDSCWLKRKLHTNLEEKKKKKS